MKDEEKMATLISSPWSTGRRFSVKVKDISAEQAKLTASDGANSDYFGYSVAVSGDGSTAVIGAYGDDDRGSYRGSAYIFV
jgi:predicted SPOUT superfamily RNA methylase MTH1